MSFLSSNPKYQKWTILHPRLGSCSVEYSGGVKLIVNGCSIAVRFTNSETATSGPCFANFASSLLTIEPKNKAFLTNMPLSPSKPRRGSVRNGQPYSLLLDGVIVEEMSLHSEGTRDLRNMQEGEYSIAATDFSSPDKPARPAFTYRFMANAKQYTVELFLSGRILTVHCNDEIVCGGNLRSNDVFVFYVCSLSLKQVKCEVRAGGDGELSLYAITGNSTIQIQPFTKVGIVIEVVPEFERGESKENEVNPFDVDGEDFVEEEKREETEEGKEDQAAAAVAAAAAGAKTCVLPRGVEDAGDGTFDARIRDHNNKYRWLGNFPTPDQASEVYERARDDKGARGESSRRK